MICASCGQRTSGDYCQHCHYPLFEESREKQRKARIWAKEQAQREAKEKARTEYAAAIEQAKLEAEEARKAREKT
ncbi:MAG: hypothetical protein QGG79_00420, partial [Dehalococcoidales bacterium]|nr:hypothetical protein [Dehalococcoidales bacterium]